MKLKFTHFTMHLFVRMYKLKVYQQLISNETRLTRRVTVK